MLQALEPSREYQDEGKRHKRFRKIAFLLIKEMVSMDSNTKENTSFLVDEILHSIFFLGKIIFTENEYFPENIFDGNENFLQYLKETFPQPFVLCSSQIPRRSPFSCVLDMIVKLFRPEEDEKIKEKLQQLIEKLKQKGKKLEQKDKELEENDEELEQNDNTKMLFSNTLCVSSVSDSEKYYGVSMSTYRTPARQIIIASACLNFWDDYVAGAVMTYFPGTKKKSYFDGTIQLPADVSCEAFSIKDLERQQPCHSCKDMFNLKTTETKKSPYGNCAEAESLSNLLKNENTVRELITQSGNVEGNDRARNDVSCLLKQVLKKHNFVWDNNFYTPQRASLENGDEEEEDYPIE